MGKRPKNSYSKRRANLNQSLACLTKTFEHLENTEGPLTQDEFFTFFACSVYVGKINALNHLRKVDRDTAKNAGEAANDGAS